MTNKKITEFTELTAPASTDVLPIIDISETGNDLKNKKIRNRILKYRSRISNDNQFN